MLNYRIRCSKSCTDDDVRLLPELTPTQAARGATIMHKCRVFTIGVVLCLMVTGAFAQGNGSLKVTSYPTGAAVAIDGVSTGKVTPMSESVPVGEHTVTVRVPNSGWNPDTRTVTVVSGNNDLSVTLLPTLAVGPQGSAGPSGSAGPAGPQGPVGATGPQGLPGAVGPQGVAGADGAAGPQGSAGAAGPAGAPGVAGPAGPAGPQGPTGLTGAGGATGPTGATGATGAQGPKGDTGATGPQGPQGPRGDTGVNWRGAWAPNTVYTIDDAVQFNGSSYVAQFANNDVTFTLSNWQLLAAQGGVGPSGPTGAAGPQGATGAVGPTGPTGFTGATGAQGSPGPMGPSNVYMGKRNGGPFSLTGSVFGSWTSLVNVQLPGGSYLFQAAATGINPTGLPVTVACAIFINGNPFSIAYTFAVRLAPAGQPGDTATLPLLSAFGHGIDGRWLAGYSGIAEFVCQNSPAQIWNPTITATQTGVLTFIVQP